MNQLFCYLLLTSFTAFAGSPDCGIKQVSLYYANGMFNSLESAERILGQIKSDFIPNSQYPEIKRYDVAYNTDEIALLQLFQVYEQKFADSRMGFYRGISKFFTKTVGDELENLAFKTDIQLILNEQYLRDKDLRIQIAQYRSDLSNNLNVVTIAHSQGNFYTFNAFEIINSEYTHMISVATPANKVYNNGPYLNFESDGVVSYIYGSPKPNMKHLPEGYFDHEFIKNYMGYEPSRQKIISYYEDIRNKIFNNQNRTLDFRDGYLHENTNDVLAWIKTIDQKSELTKPECLIVKSFSQAFARHGLTCLERNYDLIEQSIQDCIKDHAEAQAETACPFAEAGLFEIFPDTPFLSESNMDEKVLSSCNQNADFKNDFSLETINASLMLLQKIKMGQIQN